MAMTSRVRAACATVATSEGRVAGVAAQGVVAYKVSPLPRRRLAICAGTAAAASAALDGPPGDRVRRRGPAAQSRGCSAYTAARDEQMEFGDPIAVRQPSRGAAFDIIVN